MSHTTSTPRKQQQAYNYNQEVLKWMEELRNKRDILLQQIEREEKEKEKTNQEIELLNARLTKLTESLTKKSQLRSEYDKTIDETENAFRKIVESSCTLLHVLKREAKTLGSSAQQSNINQPVSIDK